jgi:hypothetical protein
MTVKNMTYDSERDCWVQSQAEPDTKRRVYDIQDGKLRIEEIREFDILSGTISEHSSCVASLSAAGPILTESEITDGMQKYHTLEGVDGL